jgi:hypothetical protein
MRAAICLASLWLHLGCGKYHDAFLGAPPPRDAGTHAQDASSDSASDDEDEDDDDLGQDNFEHEAP